MGVLGFGNTQVPTPRREAGQAHCAFRAYERPYAEPFGASPAVLGGPASNRQRDLASRRQLHFIFL
jgi:hypothetical protein